MFINVLKMLMKEEKFDAYFGGQKVIIAYCNYLSNVIYRVEHSEELLLDTWKKIELPEGDCYSCFSDNIVDCPYGFMGQVIINFEKYEFRIAEHMELKKLHTTVVTGLMSGKGYSHAIKKD